MTEGRVTLFKGYIFKQSAFLKSWNKRYCEIVQTGERIELTWQATKEDTKVRGRQLLTQSIRAVPSRLLWSRPLPAHDAVSPPRRRAHLGRDVRVPRWRLR